MKKKYLKFVLAVALVAGLQLNLQAQNVILNPDFEAGSGSFSDWGTASGTTLAVDGSDHYAVLHGENGVLYQKVTNIAPGATYQCTLSVKSILVKQTTGYGYVVETGSSLVVPTFTSGANNLKSFCENNGGVWTTLPSTTVAETNVTYSFSIQLPANATAVYVCMGTKGAVADMQVTSVELKTAVPTNVSFLVKAKATGAPVENAEIAIAGFPNPIKTNASGIGLVQMVPGAVPYAFTVSCDWFKAFQSAVTVGEAAVDVLVELDAIEQIKEVKTRISKYGDNATPYPLYGHFWNPGMVYSDIIADSITKTLDYIVGGGGLDNSAQISNKLHSLKPDFQIISYQGGWDVKASLVEGKRIGLVYYRCGVLSANISETDQTLVLNSTPDTKGLGLVASEAGNFTTWIRIGGELMKIVSVSGTSYPMTVNVERGFDGTAPTTHNVGAAATAPLFEVIPVPGGSNTNMSFFDAVWSNRKSNLLQKAFEVVQNSGFDGIWIDILSGFLGAQNMVGGNYTLWNHDKEAVLSNADINAATKDALDDIYNGFYARKGFFPQIYGNNVLYSLSLTSSDRAYIMVKTTEHPRGLDGFCHENSWGHMTDVAGSVDNDGNPVATSDKYVVACANNHFLEWYMGSTWINNCKAIALLAQNNLPNQPMTINAGFKNQWFASDLTQQVRYDFNKYCYASYLMCVNVAADNSISCRMGISPQIVGGGTNSIKFEPYFYYPIGVPTQSLGSTSFTQYRIGTGNLYARRFSNGIVLVNPFSTDMATSINLSDIGDSGVEYIDPENGNAIVASVQLKSRESKILLFKQTLNGIKDNHQQKTVELGLSPVPATTHLRVSLLGNGLSVKDQCGVEVFNQAGILVKQLFVQNIQESFVVPVSDLTSGIYFIRLPELGYTGKFIKK